MRQTSFCTSLQALQFIKKQNKTKTKQKIKNPQNSWLQSQYGKFCVCGLSNTDNWLFWTHLWHAEISRPGIKPCSNQSHSSDNAASLTCWATKELQTNDYYSKIIFSLSSQHPPAYFTYAYIQAPFYFYSPTTDERDGKKKGKEGKEKEMCGAEKQRQAKGKT